MKAIRAISKFLTDNIAGLYSFKDELAFISAGNPFPYFLTDVISTQKKDLGCGLWDQTISSGDDTFTQLKIIKKHIVLRFTIRAVNTPQQNGNDIANEITEEIDHQLFELCRNGGVNLIDPVSNEVFYIEKSLFQSRSDIAPIENKMPFIYQQSLSYKFIIQDVITSTITTPFNNLTITI